LLPLHGRSTVQDEPRWCFSSVEPPSSIGAQRIPWLSDSCVRSSCMPSDPRHAKKSRMRGRLACLALIRTPRVLDHTDSTYIGVRARRGGRHARPRRSTSPSRVGVSCGPFSRRKGGKERGGGAPRRNGGRVNSRALVPASVVIVPTAADELPQERLRRHQRRRHRHHVREQPQ